MERKSKISILLIFVVIGSVIWIPTPLVNASKYFQTNSNFKDSINCVPGSEFYVAYDRLPNGETSGQKSLTLAMVVNSKTVSGGFTVYTWLSYHQRNVSLIVNFAESVAGYPSNQTNIYSDRVEIICTQIVSIPSNDWFTARLDLNKLLADSFKAKGLETASDVWSRPLPSDSNELAGFSSATKDAASGYYVAFVIQSNITLTARAPQISMGNLFSDNYAWDMVLSGFSTIATMGGVLGLISVNGTAKTTHQLIKKKS